jgi:pimeloyl-ACP methyl ester carboxylesterase
MAPETRYARSGELHIAYQVVGDGAMDLVYVPSWISQVEHYWDEPLVARYFNRLASFSRLIMFDRRGSGLSDPVPRAPTLEEQMDDVVAVMDAAGSERAAVFALLEGGAMAALFAATHPERTGALVLYEAQPRMSWAPDYDWAMHREEREAFLRDGGLTNWGDGSRIMSLSPKSADNSRLLNWYARLERLSASPGTALQLMRMNGEVDVRAVLPTISVPTLVLHRAQDQFIDIRHSRYLAEHIPGARLVELPGEEALSFGGDGVSELDEIEEFLTGTRHRRDSERILATVMFADIVDSTRRAAEMGDRRWRDLLESMAGSVGRELTRFRGRAVKTMGDGFLATFDGPARGIRCAAAIRDGARSQFGLEVRSGLHTGEIELIGDDVGGIAVHIGARVGASAAAGEVLVSGTVKDLVVGSGIVFEDRGETELKGVPGRWHLWAATA